MQQIIECADLGIVRNIPAEMVSLQHQNAKLLKANNVLKIILVLALVGGTIYLIKTYKEKHDEEKRRKNP